MLERLEGWSAPYPIPVAATTTTKNVAGPHSKLVGWSLRESTGLASAVFRLHSGDSANGNFAASVGLTVGDDSTVTIAPEPLDMNGGITIEIVSGSVEGSIWVQEKLHHDY